MKFNSTALLRYADLHLPTCTCADRNQEIHEQMKSVHPEFDPDALLEARNLTKKFELESDLVPRWGGKVRKITTPERPITC